MSVKTIISIFCFIVHLLSLLTENVFLIQSVLVSLSLKLAAMRGEFDSSAQKTLVKVTVYSILAVELRIH